jgi:chromosomal replication initiation ATPase DnaA
MEPGEKCLSGSGEMPTRLAPQQILGHVCRSYELDLSVLREGLQQRNASESRAVAGWLARESGKVTFAEIAGLVNRDIGMISSAVRRLIERLQQDPDLACRLLSLKAEINKGHLASWKPDTVFYSFLPILWR